MRNSAAFGRLRLPQPGGSPAGGRKAANAALLRIVPDLWSGTMSPCLAYATFGRQSLPWPSAARPGGLNGRRRRVSQAGSAGLS